MMTGNLGDHHLFLLCKNDDGILNEVTSMSLKVMTEQVSRLRTNKFENNANLNICTFKNSGRRLKYT